MEILWVNKIIILLERILSLKTWDNLDIFLLVFVLNRFLGSLKSELDILGNFFSVLFYAG